LTNAHKRIRQRCPPACPGDPSRFTAIGIPASPAAHGTAPTSARLTWAWIMGSIRCAGSGGIL
jgi:hypothetical protein